MARVVGILLVATGLVACDDGGTFTVPPPYLPEPPPGSAEISPDAAAWLAANAIPFAGPHPSMPHDDIEFLRELVGDARIVALGENTHGTRDFFGMKARILRFLVEEMGFDTFVIEATFPESRRMDQYLRTGEGEGRRLLQDLHFWTWRTESVLDMVEWMRGHNERGGDVSFHGVDMQFPGLALADTIDYVRSVDPPEASRFTVLLECLARYANDADSGSFPEELYEEASTNYRAECGASLDEARALFIERRDRYQAASGEDAFSWALQSLRVATQYHLWIVEDQTRDQSMAENTEWLVAQLGPERRIVLWAHNIHLSTLPGKQGFYLREEFQDDLLILAFTHERGSFMAKRAVRGVGITSVPEEMDLDPPISGSVEHYLGTVPEPRFFVDLRPVTQDTPSASWLASERRSRAIGSVYDPDRSGLYWRLYNMAHIYDVIAHFETTRPTTILPRLP